MLIHTEKEKQALLGILENSIDWYLVLDVSPENKITIAYVNKVMRENCTGVCSSANMQEGADFGNCMVFSNLIGTVLQVYKTKEHVNFSQYVFKCSVGNALQKLKILDLQVYTNNGNVVLCGRDLEPIIYEFRANTALLNHKLEILSAKLARQS